MNKIRKHSAISRQQSVIVNYQLSIINYQFLLKLFILVLTFHFSLLTFNSFSQVGVGINTSGAAADGSAIIDVSSTSQGALIPRMTTAQRNAIISPANSLLIYNTTTQCYEGYNANTLTWGVFGCLGSCQVPTQPGSITGTGTICQNTSGVAFSVSNVSGVSYAWTYSGTGFTIATGSGTNSITANFSGTATSGNLTVTPSNTCGSGTAQTFAITISSSPATPTAGLNTSSQNEIEWYWLTGNLTGQWNTTSTYPGAGNNIAGWGDGFPVSPATYTQTGLNCDTPYTLYVWATNSSGCHSPYITLTQKTVCVCSGTISTFAGQDANPCYSGACGDGGAATAATINEAYGVAIDGSGNVYIADGFNYAVRKVNTSGIISTVAGIKNSQGYSGDGGQATAAKLNFPVGVAVDGSGNLYITDEYNWRIRKVTPAGIISTFAGNGTVGYSGDGGPATAAQIEAAGQLAIDASGNVYFGEGEGLVRKVTVSTGIISTYAGNVSACCSYNGDGIPATAAYLASPNGVAFDASGNLFIAESNGQRIRKVDATTKLISTVAGSILGTSGVYGYTGDGGPATDAQLFDPWNVSVDDAGNIYISDLNNFVIRKVNTSGIICTFAGSKTWTGGYSDIVCSSVDMNLNYPYGVVVNHAGNTIYIGNTWRSNVRKVTIP